MIITKEQFEQIISSATNSTSEVFNMISPHLQDVELQLRNELLGDTADNMDKVSGLEACVMKLICLRTMLRANL